MFEFHINVTTSMLKQFVNNENAYLLNTTGNPLSPSGKLTIWMEKNMPLQFINIAGALVVTTDNSLRSIHPLHSTFCSEAHQSIPIAF